MLSKVPSLVKFSRRTFSANVAMILSGSGVYDGAEIFETTSCIAHLSRHKAKVSMFAPDINQAHTINHITGEDMKESRNVLVESARIARGNIQSLDKLKASDFQALVIPGGFGSAKNLSNFAFNGKDFLLQKDVEMLLKEFLDTKKAIGLCCISPILITKLVSGVHITMGKSSEENGRWPHAGAAVAAAEIGAKHAEMEPTECLVDQQNRIVTSPAYMCGQATPHEIFVGLGKFIDALMDLVKK